MMEAHMSGLVAQQEAEERTRQANEKNIKQVGVDHALDEAAPPCACCAQKEQQVAEIQLQI